jgi:DME family drug/metabolite transporter
VTGGGEEIFAISLALLSALMFAFTFVLVRIGVKSASSETALWLTLLINAVFLWGWSLLSYGWQFDQWWEWRYFVLAGLFAPLLGRLFQFMGMARLGSNITTPLTLTHPMVSVALATAFLGERLSYLGLIGAVMVIAGSVLVGSQGGQGNSGSLSSVPRRYLLLPLIASLSYGVSMVFRKIGIDIGSDAVTASAVTTSASWFFASLYIGATNGFARIRCTQKELGYFGLAGLFSSLGPVLLYVAMQHADLVVVAPLAATTPLFVLMMSYVFIRADEIFTTKVVVGTVATVAGVMLVTVYGLA